MDSGQLRDQVRKLKESVYGLISCDEKEDYKVSVPKLEKYYENSYTDDSYTVPVLRHCVREAGDMAVEAFALLLQQDDVIQQLRKERVSLSGKLILSQESVIELQREVIRAKDDQLSTFQSTVKTSVEESVRSSVEESVKTEMKTYSTALSQSSHVEISQVELQQVVKAVVAEEDRSHKLILFGLLEQSSENLERTVSVGEVLLEIGEKPRIVAERIGRPSDNRVTRSSAKDHRGARTVLVSL